MTDSTYKLNKDRTVAVSNFEFWQDDMNTCPRSVKVQLLGQGGVAHYGTYNGDKFWVAWAPLPRRKA